jgi:hypothetical protein
MRTLAVAGVGPESGSRLLDPRDPSILLDDKTDQQPDAVLFRSIAESAASLAEARS